MSANRLRTTILRDLALISFVAVLVMFTNLGGPRLWDRDEPRNAGCAHEMLLRGDWITPVFNAELRAHKPVLLYWLTMSAYTVLGVNEFSARFWSAVLAVGTVFCTYCARTEAFSASDRRMGSHHPGNRSAVCSRWSSGNTRFGTHLLLHAGADDLCARDISIRSRCRAFPH